MPVLLQNVDLSWSQQTIRHWRFDICLGGAMTRWTWNGALEKENCNKCPCCLQRGKQQYIIPLRKRSNVLHACYIQRKSGTSALSFERENFSYSSQAGKMWKEAMTDRKQLFIRTHIHKASAAACTISRTAGPSIFVSPKLKSPRKIPTVPAQREDYCFPICCPLQTQPYQSKPGQLLFHILLMYWKAFHSRLPLTAGPEQVSVPNSTMENNQAFLLD